MAWACQAGNVSQPDDDEYDYRMRSYRKRSIIVGIARQRQDGWQTLEACRTCPARLRKTGIRPKSPPFCHLCPRKLLSSIQINVLPNRLNDFRNDAAIQWLRPETEKLLIHGEPGFRKRPLDLAHRSPRDNHHRNVPGGLSAPHPLQESKPAAGPSLPREILDQHFHFGPLEQLERFRFASRCEGGDSVVIQKTSEELSDAFEIIQDENL